MEYTFQFGVVFASLGLLAKGAWLTVQLSAAAMVAGLVFGTLFAVLRGFGGRWADRLIGAYVEVIRNTPFLIQLFLIYFGLPSIGISLDPVTAALIGMSINCAAYTTEIIRAGIMAVPRGQIEAARALAFSTMDIIRHIVLFPALRVAAPALGSQFILVMLGSSVVSTVSAEELTAVGHVLETETFRPFEVYIVVTLIYLAIAFAMKLLFAWLDMAWFARRGRL
ncbi:amino acid ABC transporter permease [Roseomonas indoligenes]|uniref:Amino acid ABC transporter permease n=1 Tax=Roseomonas indoligenes TaxID=2820811 RepID=A0A940N2E4_9PROT|nr:amino acid ABC transporter permease [Pararoseomonas indoligenes]MBP0495497.1 amino acid ABC transporter permease [Pararoseomonas indoligenes]